MSLRAVVLLASAVGLGAPTPAEPAERTATPPSPALMLLQPRVAPRHAYFGARAVGIDFRIGGGGGPRDLSVEVVRQASGRVARRFALAQAVPHAPQHIDWDNLTDAGRVAPNGAYRVRVAAPGTGARQVGELTLHGHVFPVRGPHSGRGPIGQFGAPRSGGRTHGGVDVNAACATPLVAARAGRVVRRSYDPMLYGNYVIIRGRRTKRDYWYAHLRHPPPVRVGQQVATGQRIGRVGDTGNARTVGCHLHFELRVHGRPIDPGPLLRAWDGWS